MRDALSASRSGIQLDLGVLTGRVTYALTLGYSASLCRAENLRCIRTKKHQKLVLCDRVGGVIHKNLAVKRQGCLLISTELLVPYLIYMKILIIISLR
jgi:hypothetical protein